MGYHEAAIVDVTGHSGGLWALAQDCSLVFSVFDVNPQAISFKVVCGREEWMCSAVYASPIPTICNLLWDYLMELRSHVEIPWMLLVDFKETFLPSEVQGGNFSFQRAVAFGRVL